LNKFHLNSILNNVNENLLALNFGFNSLLLDTSNPSFATRILLKL